MAISFRQTDTLAPSGAQAAGTGLTVSTGADATTAVEGGTAGTTALAASVTKGATNEAAVMYEIDPGFTNWDGGTWTIRTNCTTANSAITWKSVYVVRMNSAGTAQATLASDTALSIGFGTTGVKSTALTVPAVTATTGDRLYIVLGFANSNAMSAQSVSTTSDQFIDTPLTAPPPDPNKIDTPTILTEGSTTTDAASFTTASIAPAANALLLVGAGSGSADPAQTTAPTAVSGLGLTWTKLLDQMGPNTDGGGTVWYATTGSTAPAAGAVTIDYGATAQQSAAWQVVQVTNANLGAPIVQSGSVNGTTTSASVTLAAALGADNATFGLAVAASSSNTFTAGSGHTLLGARQAQTSPSLSLQFEYAKTGTSPVAMSFSSASTDKALIAFEVEAPAAASTTKVTATRGTTWHTAAPITSSRATTWHAASSATATRGTTWHASATVQESRSATWHAAAAVMSSRASTWDVAANATAVTATRGTTWHAAATVTATRATTWTARATVTASRGSTWTAASSVNASRATTWAAASSVTASRGTSWNAAAAVTASRPTTWAASASVSASRATTWAAAAPVASSRATTWDIASSLTAVTASRGTTWTVIGTVTATRGTTWHTRTTLASPAARGTTWAVWTTATSSRATSWSAAGSVTVSRTSGWDVKAQAATAKATSWTVRATTTAPRVTSWRTAALTTAQRATAWDVLTTAFTPSTTPDERRHRVEADARSLTVPRDSDAPRVERVPADDRAHRVDAEVRSERVPADLRVLTTV